MNAQNPNAPIEKYLHFTGTVIDKAVPELDEQNLFIALNAPGAREYLGQMLSKMIHTKLFMPITEVEAHHRLDGKIHLMQYLLTGE